MSKQVFLVCAIDHLSVSGTQRSACAWVDANSAPTHSRDGVKHDYVVPMIQIHEMEEPSVANVLAYLKNNMTVAVHHFELKDYGVGFTVNPEDAVDGEINMLQELTRMMHARDNGSFKFKVEKLAESDGAIVFSVVFNGGIKPIAIAGVNAARDPIIRIYAGLLPNSVLFGQTDPNAHYLWYDLLKLEKPEAAPAA